MEGRPCRARAAPRGVAVSAAATPSAGGAGQAGSGVSPPPEGERSPAGGVRDLCVRSPAAYVRASSLRPSAAPELSVCPSVLSNELSALLLPPFPRASALWMLAASCCDRRMCVCPGPRRIGTYLAAGLAGGGGAGRGGGPSPGTREGSALLARVPSTPCRQRCQVPESHRCRCRCTAQAGAGEACRWHQVSLALYSHNASP